MPESKMRPPELERRSGYQIDTLFTLDHTVILNNSNAIAGFRYGPYKGEIFDDGALVIHGFVDAEILGFQSKYSEISLPSEVMIEIERLMAEYWDRYDQLNNVDDPFGTYLVPPDELK